MTLLSPKWDFQSIVLTLVSQVRTIRLDLMKGSKLKNIGEREENTDYPLTYKYKR